MKNQYYFLCKTKKKYFWMSSAAVVIGALTANTNVALHFCIGIGHLRKSGGQKIDLISLLLNKFS